MPKIESESFLQKLFRSCFAMAKTCVLMCLSNPSFTIAFAWAKVAFREFPVASELARAPARMEGRTDGLHEPTK